MITKKEILESLENEDIPDDELNDKVIEIAIAHTPNFANRNTPLSDDCIDITEKNEIKTVEDILNTSIFPPQNYMKKHSEF